MSRVSALNRKGVGARKVDMTPMQAFIEKVVSLKQPAHVGQVFEPEGEGSFWERGDHGEILVHVETFPEGQDLTCRLGSLSGGAGSGIWMVPKPGTTVGVICPSGELDHYPYIDAILDSCGAPERVSPDRAIWFSDTPIEIETPDLRLGDHAATEPVPHGNELKTAIDTFIDAVKTFATGLNAGTLSGQATALVAALEAVKLLTYLSPKVKVA
jgi:hypothetical protein